MERAVFKNRWLPYVLVLPQLVITLVFFFWPAFQSLRLSLLRVSPFGDRVFFVGLRNFQQLFSSVEYRISVVNTIVFTLGVTFVTLIVSLIAALLANQKIRGRPLYRTLLLVPYGIAPPVAGVVWLFLFHPAYGIVQYLFSFFTDWELNWYVDGAVAMALVILTSAWTHLGYDIAFFLAGLQLIPRELLEAASVDGATPFQRLLHVTLPLLSPIIFFLIVMNMIYALFDTFGVIHAITRGGPGTATETLVYKAYKDGFLAMNMGSSSAQSVVLMVLAIIFTWLQFRFIERRVSY
ncbi:MAG TPA: sugar ABC transporter permease [Limnochordia bacterium]|nr:sugar ABC transporter permease [Limnochordia bacterium]